MQRHAIALPKQPAVRILTGRVVGNAIAIADVEVALGAIAPDCMLNEPRKYCRKRGIELPRIDVCRNQSQNAGASEWAIAPVTVGMIRRKSPKDAGPMQEIMHERVDGDQAHADREPRAFTLSQGHQ